MKHRLSSFITQVKLTVTYMIFGLVVGLASFWVTTILTGREALTALGDIITAPLKQSVEEEGVENLGNTVRDLVNRLPLDQMAHTFLPNGDSASVVIKVYIKRGSLWQLEYDKNLASGAVIPLVSGEESAQLDRALDKGDFRPITPYLGIHDSTQWLIRLNPPDAEIPAILLVGANRAGLRELIRQDLERIAAYATVVLIISWFLGLIFAKRTTRSLRKLSDTAARIATGDLEARFPRTRYDEIGRLGSSLDTMAINLNHRIQSMRTMNRIDRAVLSSQSGTELLSKVAGYISEQYEGAGVAILEAEAKEYRIVARVPGEAPTEEDVIPREEIPREILADIHSQAFLIANGRGLLSRVFPQEHIRARAVRIPLFQKERFMGFVVVTLDEVGEQDWEALQMLTDQAGVTLQSVHESEQRESMYMGLIRTLPNTVDAKSPWTAGHSAEVARLSVGLTRELGLDEGTCELVRISALLHDIGKLAVDETILVKPGRLTADEYDMVKLHPVKGEAILDPDIPNFDTIRAAIRHHHEAWDGSGYPDGLSGESIPFLARIITVADVWEAITADRPYRKGMRLEEATTFMQEKKGVMFEPGLVDALYRYLQKGYS